jgi:Ca2+/Na+ antiporter
MYILLGALFLVMVLLGVKWFIDASPHQLAKIARMGLVVMAGAALFFLTLSGRLAVILTGILALLPFIPYANRLWRDSQEEAKQEELLLVENTLSRKQALEILGLTEGAEPAQIQAAHRRLIQKIHPDKGGSSFLSAQVNRAKEVLLGE